MFDFDQSRSVDAAARVPRTPKIPSREGSQSRASDSSMDLWQKRVLMMERPFRDDDAVVAVVEYPLVHHLLSFFLTKHPRRCSKRRCHEWDMSLNGPDDAPLTTRFC